MSKSSIDINTVKIFFLFLVIGLIGCKADPKVVNMKELNLYPFKGVVKKRFCYYKIDLLENTDKEELKRRANMPEALAIKYVCIRNIAALEGDTVYFDCKPVNYNFFIDCQTMDSYDARMSVALIRVKRNQLDH